MPTKFAALMDKVDAACDAQFGETFEFRPMQSGPGGGLPIADPNRSIRDVVGIHEADTDQSTEFGSEARGSVPRSVTQPFVSIDRRQFLENEQPRRKDILMRRDTAQLFEIANVMPDDEGRVKIAIIHKGSETV